MTDSGKTGVLAVVFAAIALCVLGFGWMAGASSERLPPLSDVSQIADTGINQHDLRAQQSMAASAFAMILVSGLVGLMSFGVSIVGTRLLYRTLEFNRLAVEAAAVSNLTARQIGEAEVRAYIHCIGATFEVRPEGVLIRVSL